MMESKGNRSFPQPTQGHQRPRIRRPRYARASATAPPYPPTQARDVPEACPRDVDGHLPALPAPPHGLPLLHCADYWTGDGPRHRERRGPGEQPTT